MIDNKNILNENKAPIRADYIEKREIDRSTLYSFDGAFQLLHADLGNLEFLGKNATFPQYVLVIVDLFSSTIYTYPMKSGKQILQKQRKSKRMTLQVDNEFQQVKIKNLNDINNVEMFTSAVKGGKAFAGEQKIRELKTRIAKINVQKLKISPTKIIEMSTANMNLSPSKKYGLAPVEIEQRALSNECFKTIFNMKRMDKTQGLHSRLDEYHKKKYSLKKKQLREDLSISEKVYVLAERIKKKSAPGKFYKQFVQNISYFNKEKIFTIRATQTIDKITYYWLKNTETNRKLTKRFTRTELFALQNNFLS